MFKRDKNYPYDNLYRKNIKRQVRRCEEDKKEV